MSCKSYMKTFAGNINIICLQLDGEFVTPANWSVSDSRVVCPYANIVEWSKCGVIKYTRTTEIGDT